MGICFIFKLWKLTVSFQTLKIKQIPIVVICLGVKT